MSLYDDIGVEKGAPPSVIKAAYRKLAAQHHPDRGGDENVFKVIQKAYDVLGDEKKRKRYDETGETEDENSVRKQALNNLAALLLHTVDSIDIGMQSIKAEMLKAIRMNIDAINQSIAAARVKIAARESAALRLKLKTGDDDLLVEILRGSIRAEEQVIANAKHTLEICAEMTSIIDAYEYSTYKVPAMATRKHRIYTPGMPSD